MVPPELGGDASKRLPPAAVMYSTTDLELLGLCVNISQSKHLLAKLDLGCTIDHLTLTYIMKSKTEPASVRVKRILEVLSAYLFNLHSIQGKDMTLSDFFP